MLKNPLYIIIPLIIVLLSCSPEWEISELNLIPMPQQVNVSEWGMHPLPLGKINDSVITIRLVNEIPEATINQEEAYRLVITTDTIQVAAVTQKGIYWARQTLEQLVAEGKNGKKYLPLVKIIDWPAFRVRGFMHDVGRSFISVDELKEQIALLSKYKINTFHWHLTENQGWRLQSKRFPELNDSANFERLPGKFYTIEEAKEMADWCKKHHVLLIPEIDMPGHSAAFVRATGHDMQSPEGIKILKDLIEEISTEVFPDLPYIHIGTDEVRFTNPNFVPDMVSHIRGLGKKVIAWNPGWNYQPGEIDATQLWSYRGKAQPGIPAIDSRFHYMNHYDAFGDIVALYNSRVYDSEQGNDDLAGSILAVWNDRLLPDEEQIIMQNHFYPNMLAFAERTWRGGGTEYFNKNGPILPTDPNDPVFQSFSNFEQRMLWHKERHFEGKPFPYVKQTDIRWRITDPFPNEGDLTRSFPPEEKLTGSYLYEGKEYGTRDAVGASIYLRHVWDVVPGFYETPRENHTAYAYTWVWSPKKQEVGLWITTQEYSRSESDLPPPQGKWDYRESRVYINNEPLDPPTWENTHKTRTNEITLKNENFTARPPLPVTLKKGWNKVFLKLPIGKFSTPEVRLQKWMFTFVFVTPDGRKCVPDLVYNPDKYR